MTTVVRDLPKWLGGACVSPLAYRVVCVAFGDPPIKPFRAHRITPIIDRASLVEVVDHLTLMLDVDEYDVLIAMAELQRADVFRVTE